MLEVGMGHIIKTYIYLRGDSDFFYAFSANGVATRSRYDVIQSTQRNYIAFPTPYEQRPKLLYSDKVVTSILQYFHDYASMTGTIRQWPLIYNT